MSADVIEIIVPVAVVVEVTAPVTTTVEIVAVGPQGPIGPPNATPLSTDAGNQLIFGVDGGLFAHATWASTDW
jgi:hypothetical protein